MSQAQMCMQECRLTILVNWRREGWGKVGYCPSCSLPMRIGRAGAVKTDCFAALVISTETYSGMFFIRTEAAAPASSSHTELWSCSLLRGLGGSGPTQREQTAFTTSFSFPFSKQWGSLFPGVPTLWQRKRGREKKAKQGLVFYYC